MTSLSVRLRPRGLAWSLLTPHRTVLRIYLACVALGVVSLLGLYVFGEGLTAALARCGPPHPPCSVDVIQDEAVYDFWASFASGSLAYLPVVVAAFAGAVLVGREMEHGTAALGWTQAVSPTRWLATKLTVPALLLVGGMALLSPLYQWVLLSDHSPGRMWWFKDVAFLAGGPTLTAYLLFGLVFGAVVGLWLRRTLAALAVAVTGTGVAQILGHVYRSDLWPTVFRKSPELSVPNAPPLAEIVETGGVTASGERFSFDTCFATHRPDYGIRECLQEHDAVPYTLFHPASHYWPLQLVETGIVLGLTAALTVTAFWLLRRRLP